MRFVSGYKKLCRIERIQHCMSVYAAHEEFLSNTSDLILGTSNLSAPSNLHLSWEHSEFQDGDINKARLKAG